MDHAAWLKTVWRGRIRAQRRDRPQPDPLGHQQPIPGLAAVLPDAGERVAAFESVGSEPSTVALLAGLAADGLRILVPARSGAGGEGWGEPAWVEVLTATCALPVPPTASRLPSQAVQPGRGQVLEAEALGQCQLILVPALAVDRSGTRLGQGGGWYDRALTHRGPGALTLAVCYPHEVLPGGVLPRETHDLMVDGALTARGVELFDTPQNAL
ncbi:MAG: 5-formyltetrahydrofolate cyclo-ligase [Bifidobacteriaceae bacterium]|jgi:5-formyltetrahydrofolate cyclo-ligase|nr:5-formyltetrahydrofolate cyclo-ligase [Bifidobacteriaceae bacterium]